MATRDGGDRPAKVAAHPDAAIMSYLATMWR